MSRGTPESCGKSHSHRSSPRPYGFLHPQHSSMYPLWLSGSNLGSQHGTISGSSMERWLHKNSLECHWTPYTSCAGGIERRGQRPPTPYLPPRLAAQPISGGNGGIGSPHCVRCNARVCIEDIHREMLKTSVLKFVRRSVPNDPTDPTDPTSFRYVCPVCPVCGFVQVYELSQRARFTIYA